MERRSESSSDEFESYRSLSIPRSKPAPKHTLGSKSISSTQSRIDDLLRKSLSGELLDTQFYAFSARSKLEATKPRALFSNDEALVASSKYFRSLLSKKSLNDPTLVELQDHEACEESISINDYGYASDSDLDEEEDETSATAQANEVGKFVASEVQRIILSRRILVTDTAFKTWQALLYYLYTDQIVFAPLRSQSGLLVMPGISCSPKSMYRLACKIKHVTLQDKALAAIRSSLTERNIVQEITSSLTLRFPAILEMEVETLFQHVATPTVMKDFPTLIKRIALAGLPHGADILIQLHERMLKQHYPRVVSPKPEPEPVTVDLLPDIISEVPKSSKGMKASVERPRNKGW